MEREEVERTLTHALARTGADVVAAYLFGSVARSTPHPGSDVDLGILVTPTPPSTLDGLYLDLQADLIEQTGYPIQLVVMNRAPADLVHRILRDGRILLDRDRSLRIRFEVKRRNEYFDLKPILDRYRRVG